MKLGEYVTNDDMITGKCYESGGVTHVRRVQVLNLERREK